MIFLTEREREQLRLQHKRERDKRICDRIKAILLYDEGWTPQQIAKVLLITDQFRIFRSTVDGGCGVHSRSGTEKPSQRQI